MQAKNTQGRPFDFPFAAPFASLLLRYAQTFHQTSEVFETSEVFLILYDTVDQRRDALAERAYAPWVDMEDAMRRVAIPLYSLETKHPLAEFDILGFSLPTRRCTPTR